MSSVPYEDEAERVKVFEAALADILTHSHARNGEAAQDARMLEAIHDIAAKALGIEGCDEPD